MKTTSHSLRAFAALCLLTLVTACGDDVDSENYPQTQEDMRKERLGKLTGDGMTIGGPDDDDQSAGKNPLGVNSFLWRGTLDTLAFMPLASADPFGGVIITDWYEDPKSRGERFKVTALILDRNLRANSLKVSAFRQRKNVAGQWEETPVDTKLARKLEDTILTRARQLRVQQLGR